MILLTLSIYANVYANVERTIGFLRSGGPRIQKHPVSGELDLLPHFQSE